jgi:hypothetical protein
MVAVVKKMTPFDWSSVSRDSLGFDLHDHQHQLEFDAIVRRSESEPVKLKAITRDPRAFRMWRWRELGLWDEPGDTWVYRGFLYLVQGSYSDEQFRLLILEDFDKERRKWETLKRKFDSAESQDVASRPRIPESVRVEVWRRDGGKCARCGSREKLEYDHIVPLSKNGSNTARNVELLCEKCNRSKGGNIG